MIDRQLRLLRLLPLILLASCATYRTPRPEAIEDRPEGWDRLPYHVAIIPIDESEVIAPTAGADRNAVEFTFEFDSVPDSVGDDVVTRNLKEVLEANAFRCVSVLPPPTEEEYELLGDEGMATYWAAAAREAKADLLLDIESFEYPLRPASSPRIASYLLYVTGPLEYLYPDREYSFDEMALAVSLYDVAALSGPAVDSRGALIDLMRRDSDGSQLSDSEIASVTSIKEYNLGSLGGVVRQFRVTPDDLAVRFGDRLGKGATSGSWWTGLLVPSAFLQKNSDYFAAEITEDSALGLAKDLARDIAEGDFEYIINPRTSGGGFAFDAMDAELVSSELVDGAMEIRARVGLPASGFFSRPTVRVGAAEYEIDFLETAPTASAILAAFSAGIAPAYMTELDDGTKALDHELTVYIPSATRTAEASFSTIAPADVAQLTLSEVRGSRKRSQSWTFELSAALSESQVSAIEAAASRSADVQAIPAVSTTGSGPSR